MIDKNIDQISIDDIKNIAEASVIEKKTLEFKAVLPGKSYNDRKEFLADVSSFANTEGGYIVYGINESYIGREINLENIGFENSDIDSEISRLEDLLRQAISPRMNADIGVVKNSNKFVVIIRVDPSLDAPHRVILEGHDKFYKRNSNGKYPMDVGELRTSFIKTSSLIDRVKGFVNQRIFDIKAGDTPLPIMSGDCFLAIHVIPISSFTTDHRLNNDTILALREAKYTDFRPFHETGWSYRINLDGVLAYSSNRRDENITRTYAQLYRDGKIEIVESSVFESIRDESRGGVIPMVWLETRIMDYVEDMVQLLINISFNPPFYVYLTLAGIKDLKISLPSNLRYIDDVALINVNDLRLPPVIIDGGDFNKFEKFKPIFDVIWNAGGFSGSLNFDKDGNYIK